MCPFSLKLPLQGEGRLVECVCFLTLSPVVPPFFHVPTDGFFSTRSRALFSYSNYSFPSLRSYLLFLKTHLFSPLSPKNTKEMQIPPYIFHREAMDFFRSLAERLRPSSCRKVETILLCFLSAWVFFSGVAFLSCHQLLGALKTLVFYSTLAPEPGG